MRLALIDTECSRELIGGAQLFLPGLISGLTGRGHEVHLITRGTPNAKLLSRLDATGVELHEGLWNESDLANDVATEFARWINKLGPDIFLVSTSADIGWIVMPMLDRPIATLAIGHNDSPTYYEPARHYRGFLTSVIGVSNEICEKYENAISIARQRLEWIPYGVQTADEPPHENGQRPLRLIYIGRVEERQKRITDLVSVARALSASGLDYLFQIVGDGESVPIVRAELATEIAAGRVELLGWVDSGQVIEIVRGSEIFVLASAFEGFCIALVEAMANGCSPIVTDIRSGNKQLVRDGENGFVVPVGDIDAFVDRIRRLDSDREMLLRMRRAAWETGKEYSIERMVDAYEHCFERAIEDARANPRTPDPDFPLMPSCRSKYPLWMRRIKARIMSKPAR